MRQARLLLAAPDRLPDPVVGESPALAGPEPRVIDVRVAFTVILLLPAQSYSRLLDDFRSPQVHSAASLAQRSSQSDLKVHCSTAELQAHLRGYSSTSSRASGRSRPSCAFPRSTEVDSFQGRSLRCPSGWCCCGPAPTMSFSIFPLNPPRRCRPPPWDATRERGTCDVESGALAISAAMVVTVTVVEWCWQAPHSPMVTHSRTGESRGPSPEFDRVKPSTTP